MSLAARRYERVGRLLATAMNDVEREGIPVGEALVCAARLVGQDLGRQARHGVERWTVARLCWAP
jgi:hypothetical protein